jgi:NDP-sugar pyrophosphorylase family protein
MTAAVVLAAGPGTRLGELGLRLPKAMVPVAGRPHLEHLARFLLGAGLRLVVVAVHHRADVVRRHFADSRSWPGLVFVTTSQGGTGADLLECLAGMPDEPFVVWNGDTIVDPTAQERRARDLEATILPDLIARGLLRAFDNGTRYFLDFGTPERLARLTHDGFTYRPSHGPGLR